MVMLRAGSFCVPSRTALPAAVLLRKTHSCLHCLRPLAARLPPSTLAEYKRAGLCSNSSRGVLTRCNGADPSSAAVASDRQEDSSLQLSQPGPSSSNEDEPHNRNNRNQQTGFWRGVVRNIYLRLQKLYLTVTVWILRRTGKGSFLQQFRYAELFA